MGAGSLSCLEDTVMGAASLLCLEDVVKSTAFLFYLEDTVLHQVSWPSGSYSLFCMVLFLLSLILLELSFIQHILILLSPPLPPPRSSSSPHLPSSMTLL